MDRRTLLAAIGTGFVGLAGCSGSSDPQPTAGEPTPAGTASAPATTAGVPKTTARTPPPDAEETPVESAPDAVGDAVRLFSIGAPSRAQIGESVQYRFTLENTGSEEVVVEPTVSSRVGSAGWTELDRWDPARLAPDARASFNSQVFSHDYLAPVELRIDGYDETFTIDFEERQLTFTEHHVDPLGREVSVESLSNRGTYEYTSGGTRYLAEAGDDLQWVLVTIKVVNRVVDSIMAPDGSGFSLHSGDRSYRQVGLPDDSGYEPQRLPQGSGATGTIAFKTPTSISRDDFVVGWEKSFDDGDVGVQWRPRG